LIYFFPALKKYGKKMVMSKTPILLAVIGLIAILMAFGLNEFVWQNELTPDEEVKTETSAPPSSKATTPVKEPTTVLPSTPSFDVVRVNPEGDTVIAGRAMPGSEVRILENGEIIGTVIADESGEWVFIPETPLLSGSRSLSLSATLKDGTVVTSTEDVVIAVPEGAGNDAPKKALVLKFPKDRNTPVRVIQTPGEAIDRDAFSLTIETLDYDVKGQVVIGGGAPRGAKVQLYLDDDLIARLNSDAEGRWIARPDKLIPPGLYQLRADQVGDGGKVIARVEYPFSRAEDLQKMAEGTYVLVQPGNSLWRIARRVYGSGFLYSQIFEANKDRIGDPDMIFPGEVFEVPAVN